MNVLANAQASIEVAGKSQVSVVGKPAEVQKTQATPLDLSKVMKPSEIKKEDVEAMVDALKDLTETLQTKLNFSVDSGTNSIVVKVIDKGTDKVIRQIPPEAMLELQEKMQDLTGFLLSENI
ncbi:MAG: flagellar protein FlaG [Pseudomonadota bacterium]